MPLIPVPNCGATGVIKDLSVHELPLGAWTDAQNIRFLDGSALQFLGHGSVFGTPPDIPQYVMAISVAGVRYWLYTSASKQYVVTNVSGSTVYTDVTHVTPRVGTVNQWTGTVFGGIPILNSGDTTKIPMYWDQNLTHKFLDLPAWPAGTYCESFRSYKNLLIAMNITKAGVSYPYKVKWSTLAEAGSLPTTWDPADQTQDAGELDVADGLDVIVDGLALKDSFIVYKESSTFRLDFIGGAFVLSNKQVFGMTGLLNKNCAVEFDAFHFAVTGSDVVVHDGYTAQSVFDKKARRFFFQNFDVDNRGKVFVFKNPFLNEIFVCYPQIGSVNCDRALVYNWVDKTISFRSLPNVNHAATGPFDNTLGGSWNQDNDAWDSDLTAWNGPDYTPDTVRVLMASQDQRLFLLDASASFDGSPPDAYLERTGLSLTSDEYRTLVTAILPRITGNPGDTVIVKIGGSDDPYETPEYTEAMTYVIGETYQLDGFAEFRYIAIRFESGTAYQWRLDSFSIDAQKTGRF